MTKSCDTVLQATTKFTKTMRASGSVKVLDIKTILSDNEQVYSIISKCILKRKHIYLELVLDAMTFACLRISHVMSHVTLSAIFAKSLKV